MTKVIRLHKDDEILLIRKQKQILQELNFPEEKNIAFPFFPLLIELKDSYFSEKSIQELKKSFEKIYIEEAVVLRGEIFCPVQVKMNGGKSFSEKLLLGTCKKEPEHKLFPGAEKIIFKELRIFQLAEEKKSGIQTELWNSTWIKCR